MEGTTLADRYEIRDIAGKGGMGTVYRAHDHQGGSDVAIKVVSATEPSDLARFDREARVLMRLSHPYVVACRDRGVTADGRPYLVLDWLEGETLADRLGGGLPNLQQALSMTARIARALGHAHAGEIVHRDVKPSNVFLVGPGWDEPRILDFGVARVLAATKLVTRSGTALGTPAYMAPEQARGRRDVDARADVYALGCLLFECLSGERPFDGEDVMAVLAKVLFEEAPRLASLASGVPDALDDLVARLLSKDPLARPAGGDEVADLLASIADDLDETGALVRLPSNRPPRPLGTREQKLVAVVASAAIGDGGAAAPLGGNAPTIPADVPSTIQAIADQVAAFGGRFAPLADGSSVAVLEGVGSATDLALRAARCALALRARRPEIPLAIAMGRATSERVPVGEVIDRVAELLRRAERDGRGHGKEPAVIALDELGAGLLDQRFVIGRDDAGPSLGREREAAIRPRLLLGRKAPCVGRARELRMLSAFYDECLAEPVASLAVVTGASGMGKTRLVGEGASSIATGDPAPAIWLGRGDPITAGSPLALVASALRSALGLGENAVDDAAREQIAARVARHVEAADVRRVAEFLGEMVGTHFPDAESSVQLLSARSDKALMGDQLRRAFEDFVRAEAAAQPVVIVLDDAHWGDAASIRLIENALGYAKRCPLSVLVVGRPEVTTSFRSLTSARGALHLVVGELSRRHAELFVDEVLADVDRSVRERIVDHAGGNAFFLEELVRFVADRRGAPANDVAVMPATVVAMLQSRLETLPSRTRRFLRAASVFGNSFWVDGVAELLGEPSSSSDPRLSSRPVDATTPSLPSTVLAGAPSDHAAILERLVHDELVEPRSTSRLAGHIEHAFRHALVRDASYQMLTERDRVAGHRLAGEWLEAAGESDAQLLAEHFERGGAHAQAARCLTDAAAAALERHEFEGAVDLVARARAADTTAIFGGRLALLEAEAYRWSGDLPRAEVAARRAGELLPPGSADWFLATEQLASIVGVYSDYRPAVLWRERIAAVPFEPEAAGARLLALAAVGRKLFQLGDLAADEIVQYLVAERSASTAPLAPRVDAEIERLLGARARHRGDVAADLAGYRAAERAYERAGDVRSACNALVSVGFAFIQLGDHVAAREHLERAHREAARLGLGSVQTRASQNLALVLFATRRFDEAAASCEAVIADARGRGDTRFEGWTRIYLSRIHRATGDHAGALEQARLAMQALEGSPPAYAGALAAHALAAIDAGAPADGDIAAREALAILDEYEGIEEFESLVLTAAVRATASVGERDESRAMAERASARLERRARSIDSPALARSFLDAVPENVELREACAAVLGARSESGLARERIERVWSADAFAADAALVVERLRRHLEVALDGTGSVTRGFPGPEAILADTPPGFAPEPTQDLAAFLEHVLARSPTQHHPRYVGHQVSAAVPRAAVLGLVAQVLNNGMAAFESGPAIVALERRVIEWMLETAGFPAAGGGVLTSGGSLGNLTALLAARRAAEEPHGAILVSEQAHYSIERAAQIMGLGRDAVVTIATDDRFRLDPADLQPAMERARSRGLTPFAVVASAGATGTGSIDPLEAVADFAVAHALWMHVDGAHGASALLSARYRDDLHGLGRADSLVWDAHKLLSMPALATAVLFRRGEAAYATFAQKAAYLFEERAEPPWFDIGLRTVECTKPLIALTLYGALATLGTRVFADAVEHAYDLARAFAELLAGEPDFTVACPPDANIVCFRFVPPDRAEAELDDLQRRVRDRLRESGAFYCVLTTLRGRAHLRVTLMNPKTSSADLFALVAAIRQAGAR